MDDLESLELFSLVSRVTTELQNHLGINDKTLAEFIIDQHLKCKSFADFKNELDALGAEFPPSLIESIDRLVVTMHPKYKSKKGMDSGNREVDNDMEALNAMEKKARIFKGLAIPDKVQTWDDEEPTTAAKNGTVTENDARAGAMDDTFAMLEGLAGKSREDRHESSQATKPSRKRSRSPDYGDYDSTTYRRNRDRRKSTSRSRSPEPRERHRKDTDDRERYDRKERRNGYKNGYERRSRRDQDDDYFRRPPTPEIDDQPVLHKIYDGRVTGIKDFGAFVNLQGVRGKVDGLVHVSAMQEGARVNHPSDLVSRGQPVKVKVISIQGTRIGLSMKEVDQVTGRDLIPEKRLASGANMERLSGSDGKDRYGNLSSDVPVIEGDYDRKQFRNKKRLTSPERWEIKQLIASGAVSAADYPDIDEEYHATLAGEGEFEEEEDIDIEVRDEEPPFLAGQTKQSLELSPIRVVKAPDGSLNRAAMAGTNLAKERRELRQQEAAEKAAEQAADIDLNAQWEDPMADPEQRRFAADLRKAPDVKSDAAVPEWKAVTQGKNVSMGKRTNLSIKEQRESLPVFQFRQQLLDAVRDNQFLIVVGETGSGKTTQMTQYLAEAGYANNGIIGCTQPRRVAAMSVAKRVAEEVNCKLGEEVGYTIRFEDCTSPKTRIKYMTDGMLEREILVDPDLKRYSVCILDEAHERTISTDILFGLLKKTVKRRPDLKVIVTSATLDADKFSEYFFGCPIFSIPGRTYPVEILYSREPESDYLDAALVSVMQIHLTEPPGDILLFLTGQEEIDTSCEILYERMKALGPSVPELVILPVYSALPSEMQSRIFEPAPPGGRKVVIATNIAETSITIDGIYYVIDPGFVKESVYDPSKGMDALVVTPISQAQAKQRAGRAGRTGPAYQSEMLPTSVPEIQRKNLAHTILMLKAMGINDILGFDFFSPPSVNTTLTALEELYALSALDDEGLLTRLGRKMADFPMEPSLAKVLLASVDMGCSEEILTIVAMLSVTSVFYRPKEKQQQADQKKAKFHDPHGDHLTLLNVYNAWKQSNFNNAWCFENFIQARQMRRAQDVRKQLVGIMERYRHKIVSCGRDTTKVRLALCTGFFRNAARKDPQEGYKTLIEGTPVYLHPNSALFGKPAEHVIYNELVLTTREYMTTVTAIEPKWLVEAAPTFFKVAPTDRLSKRKKAERIQPLHNKFAGQDDWRLSAQRRQGRGGGGGTWG
ncbi:RNA helicase-like splicing factor (HRH1), putative [Talaromyces stipitatus ATCC 10500]|uniref:RNA helicase n=1 Tax=Talaromyces stipitatus (strain ATCC 10500 / CBS 375.48 / QM 6759 / NRRL 1006) TaxID=441959 RepID=B8M1P9_TALSN|nr:RNA helicase-like splicing factor (HRH1), putative [Talaromyces stipitatus ATCC 10500]EED22136.1 RNA helicase-like splicing factor (HRH1), putative [Talaromyces stipitatus ATCC 10500]